MSNDVVVANLKSLKLYGMASAIAELAQQGAPAYHQSIDLLDQLIRAEVADRQVRSINYQMKIARFPAYRDLAGFKFQHGAVSESQVRTLHRCHFLDQTENIVLIGGPGTGKTHIATALGVEAIVHHHRRVRFLSSVELVNALEREKLDGKQSQNRPRQCPSGASCSKRQGARVCLDRQCPGGHDPLPQMRQTFAPVGAGPVAGPE